MRFRRPKHMPEATFDLTPMIDVVLLLIIFFMLTSQFSASQLSPVDLPAEKGEQNSEQAKASIFVDMARDGSLKIEGEAVSIDRLTQLIAADARRAGSAEALDLVVRSDRACPSAHLNQLTSALALVGVRRWKLATVSDGGGG